MSETQTVELRVAIHAAYRHGYGRGHSDAEMGHFDYIGSAERYMEKLPAPTAALLASTNAERERLAGRLRDLSQRLAREYDGLENLYHHTDEEIEQNRKEVADLDAASTLVYTRCGAGRGTTSEATASPF